MASDLPNSLRAKRMQNSIVLPDVAYASPSVSAFKNDQYIFNEPVMELG